MANSPRSFLMLGALNASTGAVTGVTTGTSQPFYALDKEAMTLYLQTIGSPGAGTLIVEEASWLGAGQGSIAEEPQYTGTWSTITTIAYTSIGNDSTVAFHLSPTMAYHYVRVRIGTTFTNSTLVVRMAER